MMNKDQKEALEELINISFGSATAMIAELFDSFATLRVPDIRIIDMDQLETTLLGDSRDDEIFITGQPFKGNLGGEIVFAINRQSAVNMQTLLAFDAPEDGVMAPDETEMQLSILEVVNILGSSCVGKFVELLNEDVVFSPPTIEVTQQNLHGLDHKRYSRIIVIETVLEFEAEKIMGKLFIMFNDEMFRVLEQALDDFLSGI